MEILGFIDTAGNMKWSSYGIEPGLFPAATGIWHEAKCEKNLSQTINLVNKFEISSQIFFDDENAYNMGGVEIKLYALSGGIYNETADILIQDAWEGNILTITSADIGGKIVADNNARSSVTNLSGRYAIISDGTSLSFYRGESLIGKIQTTANINVDKVEISFQQYDTAHNLPQMYVESLYIGEPLYYKTITGN